jgi:hypothetical protein
MSEQYWKDRADALERENARFREAEGVLDEIRFALEEHGYVHMANGDGIRSLIQDAALAQQEPDQPAQDGEPSVDQARFERVWQQLVYSLADFFALEATDAQARSIAREVLQAADAGEADEWECSMCGETMAREATWGDCGHEHCPMLPSEMEADAAIRRTGDTGGGDE